MLNKNLLLRCKYLKIVLFFVYLLFSAQVFAYSLGVTPEVGYAGQTKFNFFVNFDGDLPSPYDVRVSVNGGHAYKLSGGPQNWYKNNQTFSRAKTYGYEFQIYDDGAYSRILRSGSFTVKPLPSISTVSVNPTSAVAGSTFTFSASLSDSLPSEYGVTVDFGAGYQTMSGSGTHYSKSDVANTTGSRSYTVKVVDNNGAAVSSKSGSYYVENLPDPHPPTLSLNGSPDAIISEGVSYTISLIARDQDSNLKNIEINWGDSGSVPDSFSVAGGSESVVRSHSYTVPGTYRWSAVVRDHTSLASNSVSKSVTVNSTIPTVDIPSVSPTSAVSGSLFTISATLSNNLPSGYKVYANFGDATSWIPQGSDGGHVLINGSGTRFSRSVPINTVGQRRLRVGVFYNENLVGNYSNARTFTVEALPVNHPPTLSLNGSTVTNVNVGESFTIGLIARDQDSNLKSIEIRWGDSGSVPEPFSVVGSSESVVRSHAYAVPGTYGWSAVVRDHGDLVSNSVSGSILVPEIQNHSPSISIVERPSVSGNTLSAKISTSDDRDVTQASFAIFDVAGNEHNVLNASDMTVISPTSIFNASPGIYTWGYNPPAATTVTTWDIDISSLADGNHTIMFYATDGSASVDSGFLNFTKGGQGQDVHITKVQVEERTGPGPDFRFSVALSGELPEGYRVFLNFDNQQGDWFKETDDGGHIELPNNSGLTYWLDTSLVKLGLRSFRAGIFDQNSQLVGAYSGKNTCTLDRCLAAVTRSNDFGNPALSGSGSQLFKNVDVANGNYHYFSTDLSVSGKGPDFNWSRAYNSKSGRWSFGYEARAAFMADTYNREIAIGPREAECVNENGTL